MSSPSRGASTSSSSAASWTSLAIRERLSLYVAIEFRIIRSPSLAGDTSYPELRTDPPRHRGETHAAERKSMILPPGTEDPEEPEAEMRWQRLLFLPSSSGKIAAEGTFHCAAFPCKDRRKRDPQLHIWGTHRVDPDPTRPDSL